MDKGSETQFDPSVPTTDACSMLRLPDELLLCIVQCLEGRARQQSLCNLSLVNHRLSLIVSEEFYCSPAVKPRHALQLVGRLLDNMKIVKKLWSLEILDEDSEDNKFCESNWGDYDFHGGDVEASDEHRLKLTVQCRRALHEHGINDDSWRWAAGLQAGDYHAYIAVIFAIIPNLQQLILSNQYAKTLAQPANAYRGRIGTPARPYLANSFDNIAQSLQKLIVLPTVYHRQSSWASTLWDLSSLNMVALQGVTHVTVPFSCLPRGSLGVAPATLQLPPNLQGFRVTGCMHDIVKFLQYFLARERHKYLLLREVETVWDEIGMDQLLESLGGNVELGTFETSWAVEHKSVMLRWKFDGNLEGSPSSSRSV